MATIAGHLQYAFDMQLSHDEKVFPTSPISRGLSGNEGILFDLKWFLRSNSATILIAKV